MRWIIQAVLNGKYLPERSVVLTPYTLVQHQEWHILKYLCYIWRSFIKNLPTIECLHEQFPNTFFFNMWQEISTPDLIDGGQVTWWCLLVDNCEWRFLYCCHSSPWLWQIFMHLLLLIYMMLMMWVWFPAQEIIFCCTWDNCLLFAYALG